MADASAPPSPPLPHEPTARDKKSCPTRRRRGRCGSSSGITNWVCLKTLLDGQGVKTCSTTNIISNSRCANAACQQVRGAGDMALEASGVTVGSFTNKYVQTVDRSAYTPKTDNSRS